MHLTQHMKIDNSIESAIKSGRKRRPTAKFYRKLMKKAEWKELLQEAYLIAPAEKIKNDEEEITPFLQSDCFYPHHAICNEKLILSVPRLKDVFVQTVQSGQYFRNEALKHHIDRHMEEMGVSDYKEVFASDFDGIYDHILNMVRYWFSKGFDQKIDEKEIKKIFRDCFNCGSEQKQTEIDSDLIERLIRSWLAKDSEDELIKKAQTLFEKVKLERAAEDAKRWLSSEESKEFKSSSNGDNELLATYIFEDCLWREINWFEILEDIEVTPENAFAFYRNLDKIGYSWLVYSYYLFLRGMQE